MVHDREPVAQDLGLLHVVRRQQDGPAVGLEAADEVPQRPPGRGVEAGRRLVEEDELGVVHERQRDREPLPLAARQVLAPGVASLAELERVDQLGRRTGLRVEAAEEVDELGDGQLRVEGGGLEADADARLERAASRATSWPSTRTSPPSGARRPSRISTVVVLPAPFGPSSPKISPRRDVEVDAVDGLDVAVALGQAADADDRFGRDGGAHRRMVPSLGRGPCASHRSGPGRSGRSPSRRTSRCRARSADPLAAGRPRAPAHRCRGRRRSPPRGRRRRPAARTGSTSPRGRRSTPAGRVAVRPDRPAAAPSRLGSRTSRSQRSAASRSLTWRRS